MTRRPRALAFLLVVLSLPVWLGGGCNPAFDFFVCFLADVKVPGTEKQKVSTKCVAWPFGFTASDAALVKNTLAIKGKGNGARYESGPVGLQVAPFQARVEFAIDRDTFTGDFPVRGYLRVEDEANPQHFLEVVAQPTDTDGYTVSASNEAGPTGASIPLPATDFVRLRIIRDATTYAAAVDPGTGVFQQIGNAVLAPVDPLRLRFGTDGLGKGTRVLFKELLFSGDAAGDAVLAPIFNDITIAFANLSVARSKAGAADFAGAVGDIDLALNALNAAIDKVTAGKETGTIEKQNQPKLALAALKDARDGASGARKTASALAAATGGSIETFEKRIGKAFRELMLASANLAGAKTTDAKDVEKHVQTRG